MWRITLPSGWRGILEKPNNDWVIGVSNLVSLFSNSFSSFWVQDIHEASTINQDPFDVVVPYSQGNYQGIFMRGDNPFQVLLREHDGLVFAIGFVLGFFCIGLLPGSLSLWRRPFSPYCFPQPTKTPPMTVLITPWGNGSGSPFSTWSILFCHKGDPSPSKLF